MTIPVWSRLEEIAPAELRRLEWVSGNSINRFTTMQSLRDLLWAYTSAHPKIDRMLAILLARDATAVIVECYYARDALVLALGQLARMLQTPGSKYFAYVLCRVTTAEKACFAFSYCSVDRGEVVQDDFIDHLDRHGQSKSLHHACYGAAKTKFVNLFNPIGRQLTANDFFSIPAEIRR